jgi:hypothetical protein
MARTSLTFDASTANKNSYDTATIQPESNALVVLFVASRKQFGGQPPSAPTPTGNGLVWKQVETTTPDNERRLTCFRGMAGAPTSGPITLSFNGEVQDLIAWSVIQFDDVDSTKPDGDAAVVRSTVMQNNDNFNTALAVPIAASADPARNTTVGALMLNDDSNGDQPVNPGLGATEIVEIPISQGGTEGATLQTQDAQPALTAMQWTWSKPGPSCAIVLEIKASLAETPTQPPPLIPTPPPAVPVPVEDLVTRFAPVLLMDGADPYMPINAQRYVEHAALWSAKRPFDETKNWGGVVGDPFPRKPLVNAGDLRGVDDGEGKFFGEAPLQLASDSDERFLELGGWKDRDEASEATVTESSANLYADRGAIVSRIGQPDLQKSRFWYHAEVIDPPTLFTIAGYSPALSLQSIVSQFTNPTMVLYYFYFPAHEQSVGAAGCPNIEAREVACHAGDWQCIGVLAETDGSGAVSGFTPRFFGHTGVRPATVNLAGRQDYRPYAYDAEGRTVMKVEPWRATAGITANQPELDGEHPRFYVAHASHSLYTSTGAKSVDPYQGSDTPQLCGKSDNAGLNPNNDWPASNVPKAAAFWAKILGGLAAGGLFGLIGGSIAAGVEAKHWLNNNNGTLTRPNDPPDPETAPTPATSLALRPKDLPVAGVPADKVQDWLVGRAVDIDGRQYDYLVDRTKQAWWPAHDGSSGFRGRWGQQVTADPLGRRSGPQFPDYPTMFLTALADGSSRSLLTLSG